MAAHVFAWSRILSLMVSGMPLATVADVPKLLRMSLRTTPLSPSALGPFEPSPGNGPAVSSGMVVQSAGAATAGCAAVVEVAAAVVAGTLVVVGTTVVEVASA